MNNKALVIILLCVFCAHCAKAQDVVNTIPCDDYKAITFNDVTVEQIARTEAVPQNVKHLLGTYSSMDENAEVGSRTFNYGENSITIYFEVEIFVTRIEITNDQWEVAIQGTTVKVGDSISSLKQSFGSNLLIGESQYVAYSFIAFGCSDLDEGVNLKIDPQTEKVKEIVYFLSP